MIAGRSFGEYLRFLAPALSLVTAVWALSLILYVAGVPAWLVRPFSVILAAAISVIMISLLVHVRHFGGYSNMIFAILIVMVWVQVLIVLRILLILALGIQDIFPPRIGHQGPVMQHIFGHLTFGVGFSTALGSAMGCLLLFFLRRLIPVSTSQGD